MAAKSRSLLSSSARASKGRSMWLLKCVFFLSEEEGGEKLRKHVQMESEKKREQKSINDAVMKAKT